MDSSSEINHDNANIYGILKSDDLIYKLDRISNIIGRDSDSTIMLNHPSISKNHAKIEYDTQTNKALLIDLNSANGTFINDMKLNPGQSIQLKSGDILSFGQSEKKYVYKPCYQKTESIQKNNINNDNYEFPLKDDKISLVNENEYESASINHFNGLNTKFNSFNPNDLNNINNNEDNLIFNQNKMNNMNDNNNNAIKINGNNNNNNNINYNEDDENIEEDISSQDNINIKYGENQNQRQMTQIIEETNPEIQSNTLLLSSNNNINKSKNKNNINSMNQKGPSMYSEIYNKNNLLEVELKGKNNEIKTLTEIYNQLQDNYNRLNAKHNALMIYASDIQKKNDVLELEIQNKDIKISELLQISGESNLSKILIEKEALISHLQEENQLYKEHLAKIKQKLFGVGGPNNLENQNISNLLDKLNNEYLADVIKYKQIISKYLAYETTCSRKWNELLLANDTLKEKVQSLSNNWNEDIKKYNNILRNNDIRLHSALEKISEKISGGFNLKKEEAAKYLVEQMNICMGEKNHLLQANSILTKKNSELEIENNKLKKEITQIEIDKRNGDNKVLLAKIDELKDAIKKKDIMYDPEKNINYQKIILDLDLKSKEKDKLIMEYKNKMDNFLKNNTFLNFDDREVVNSISKVLNQKDQVIQSLKNKIIDNDINHQLSK